MSKYAACCVHHSDRDKRKYAHTREFRRRFGRPGVDPEQLEQAHQPLAQGKGKIYTAKQTKLGTGNVQRMKRELAA